MPSMKSFTDICALDKIMKMPAYTNNFADFVANSVFAIERLGYVIAEVNIDYASAMDSPIYDMHILWRDPKNPGEIFATIYNHQAA